MSKRILKFNNGAGAILCNGCRTILKEGFSDDGTDPFNITKADRESNEPMYCNACSTERRGKARKFVKNFPLEVPAFSLS